MSDDDAEPQGPASDSDMTSNTAVGRVAPGVAFRRAITWVEVRRDELTHHIDLHDYEGVEHVARNAVDMWLIARSLCSRLIEQRVPMYPLAECDLLEATYMALLAELERARSVFYVPRTRQVLDQARQTLAAAAAKPLSEVVDAGATGPMSVQQGSRDDNTARPANNAADIRTRPGKTFATWLIALMSRWRRLW